MSGQTCCACKINIEFSFFQEKYNFLVYKEVHGHNEDCYGNLQVLSVLSSAAIQSVLYSTFFNNCS